MGIVIYGPNTQRGLNQFPIFETKLRCDFLDSKYRLNVQHKPIALVLTL